MEITGTIHAILDEKIIGDDLRLKDVVLIYKSGQYDKSLAVTLWGDNCDWPISVGQDVKFSIDLSSREGKTGQWFTSAKAWKYEIKGEADTTAPVETVADGEDLPF